MAGTVSLGVTTAGTIPYRHEFAVRIDTTGDIGAATYSLAVDGGDFVSRGTMTAFVDVVGGSRITFNAGVGSPSFTAGMVLPFLSPPQLAVAQLRTLQTRAVIESRLLAALQLAGQPTAAWSLPENGGIERSVLRMAADGIAQVIAPKLVRIAEMRFLDLAAGADLSLYALRRYKIERNPATYTIQNIKLSSVLQNDFAVGDLVVAGAGGNLYRNIDPVKLPESASAATNTRVSCRFQADSPGSAYNDVAGSITLMVTAPAGVSCVNEEPAGFSTTSLLGGSSGTVRGEWYVSPDTFIQHGGGFADTVPGVPVRPAYGSIRVKIKASGEIGTATFDWSTDGGATWTVGGTIPSVPVQIDDGEGTGAFITFTAGSNPSFIAGDIFTLLIANAILQNGADEESDDSVRNRCRGRWATLSDIPTAPLLNMWCHLASPEVDRVRVDADPNTPGGTLVIIASQIGVATPAAVIAVQDYITARLNGFRGMLAPGTSTTAGLLGAGTPQERCLVASARERQIGAAGTVTVPRGRVAAIQAEADRLWVLYLRGVGIGGAVYLSELYQQVMDAGAIEAVGLSIFQLRTPGVLTLNGLIGTDEIPVPGGRTGTSQTILNGSSPSLTSSLNWKPV